jgi:DNA-binding GntR family transcriptional regulator
MELAAVGAVDPIEPLAARAHQILRDAILSNKILPGERLSVSELARRMQISRTPVREAVQRLIYDGLAVHVPHRGADVVRVNVEDLRQLYTVREALDGLAASLACRRAVREDLEELDEILREHEVLVRRNADPKEHIELDIRFHERIRERSGNPHLVEMLGRIQGKSHLAMHSLWRGAESPRRALEEHREILEALSRGDPDEAERAARLHVARLLERLSRADEPEPSERPRESEASPPPASKPEPTPIGSGSAP